MLSGIEKSEGNCVQKFPHICSQTSTNFWENVAITSHRKPGRQEKPWPGVSLRVASRKQHVFVFYFLMYNYIWHSCSHKYQLCYFVEITEFH